MMSKKWIFALTVMALIISSPCYAQEWAKTYGEGGVPDVAMSIQQTVEGGYVVVGSSVTKAIYTYPDILAIKLDANGNIDWKYKYGDDGKEDVAKSIRQTAEGGYIVAGSKGGSMNGFLKSDFWVIKLYPDGSIDWQNRYGRYHDTLVFHDATSIQQTADGGYILAGNREYRIDMKYNACILKLDSDGNIVWQKIYVTDETQKAHSIQQTVDELGEPNGYIMAGTVWSPFNDALIVKFNLDGSIAWQKTYDGGNHEGAKSIQQTFNQLGQPDGYIVAGNTTAYLIGMYDSDVLVLRLDLDGNIIWQKTYVGEKDEWANFVKQTDEGGFIVVGETYSFGAGNRDIWTLKLDGNGDIIWQKTYGNRDNDSANSIWQTDDGGYIVAGNTEDDFWVLKLDANGEIPNCSPMAKSYGTVTNASVEAQVYTADFGSPVSIFEIDIAHLETSATEKMMCPFQLFYQCNLVPDVIVVPRGGTLGFQATVMNTTDNLGTVLFATKVTKPDGNLSDFLFGPRSVYLGPYESKSGHISHTIPTGTRLGTYTYHSYVGNYGVGLYDECQFDFYVTYD